MPATATQKKAFFQWRCTKGAGLWANCAFGAFISVSLGLKFCIGTPTRPLRAAVAMTGLNTGSLPALPSFRCDPPPLRSTGETPFLSRGLVVTSLGCPFGETLSLGASFLVKTGFFSIFCTRFMCLSTCDCLAAVFATSGFWTLRTISLRSAASAGVASIIVTARAAAIDADARILILICVAPCFGPDAVAARGDRQCVPLRATTSRADHGSAAEFTTL